MISYKKLQEILERYDAQKGKWRRAFFDHADVRTLKAFFASLPQPPDFADGGDRLLTDSELQQLIDILATFEKHNETIQKNISNNSLESTSASDLVLISILNEIQGNIADLLPAMRELKREKALYTPSNREKLFGCGNLGALAFIMQTLNDLKTNGMNQQRFDLLVAHPNLESIKTFFEQVGSYVDPSIELLRDLKGKPGWILAFLLSSPIWITFMPMLSVFFAVNHKLYCQNDTIIDAVLCAKNPADFITVFPLLDLSELTKEKLFLIANHPQPIEAGVFLKLFHQNLMATDRNLDFIRTNQRLGILLNFLRFTSWIPARVKDMIPQHGDMRERLFATHKALKLILQYAGTFERADAQLLVTMPRHLITPQSFQRFIAVCRRYANEDERVRALNAEISNIINPRDDRPAANNVNLPQLLNYAQSTHAVSIHESVSQSVIRLKQKYQNELKDIKQHLEELEAWIDSLPDLDHGNSRSAVAKRAFDSIRNPGWTYVDAVSKVSLQELIVLCWVAIHDLAVTGLIDLVDGKIRFLQSLYDLQRMYNLDDHFVDNNTDQNDRPACLPGVFNKLVECLAGAHPLVTISFVTRQVLALKLPVLVKNAAHRYIQTLIKNNDFLGRANFATLLEELKIIGMDLIFEKIKPRILAQIRKEYAGHLNRLFASDHELDAFINSGIFVPLTDLERYEIYKYTFDRFPAKQSMFASSSSSSSLTEKGAAENDAANDFQSIYKKNN